MLAQPDRPSSGIGNGQLTIFDCCYWLSVQGIVPTTLAAIKVRSAGSHTSTVPACVSAISAVIDAGLTGTVSVRSSSVTIMTSNCPSPPSVPATQFALKIFTFRACSLAPGIGGPLLQSMIVDGCTLAYPSTIVDAYCDFSYQRQDRLVPLLSHAHLPNARECQESAEGILSPISRRTCTKLWWAAVDSNHLPPR